MTNRSPYMNKKDAATYEDSTFVNQTPAQAQAAAAKRQEEAAKAAAAADKPKK